MKLFIQIKNGRPYEHPVMEDNIRYLFPNHDLETVPEGFVKFTRVKKPILVYENFDTSYGHEGCGCAYESDGSGGFKDVWHTIPMSDEEKAEKISIVKKSSFPSWTFNEADCTMQSPVDYPSDDKKYIWDEDTINWIELTNEDQSSS